MDDNLIFREIETTDYEHGYFDLMQYFSKYKYDVSREQFIDYLDKCGNSVKIIVIFSINDNKIVGAGSLHKLDKLHCNSVGQIEDVAISDNYRGLGLGKRIIEKLVDIALHQYECYKVVLNCLEHNVGFYNKCNFTVSGNQMRYNI